MARVRGFFKRSNDPDVAAELAAIAGLYLDPPAHSLVLSPEGVCALGRRQISDE